MSRLFHLKYKDLQSLTDDFSEENFIYHAQFCKLYRGKIPIYCGDVQFDCLEVTVKVWVEEATTFEFKRRARNTWDQNLQNFNDEITLLGHDSTRSCPNLPKLIGFCRNDETKQLGVVYDLKPLDVLQNLFHQDIFNWCQRIKVALGLARVIKHFHGYQPQCLIRDLSSAHVMIDQDYNPVLFNFFGLTGGVIGEKTEILNRLKLGSSRYFVNGHFHWLKWTERGDVYPFGVILLELIRKCVVCFMKEPCFEAFEYSGDLRDMYKPQKSKLFSRAKKCSLAHLSFDKDADFDVHDAYTMTDLAMLCLDPDRLPTAEKIVETLESMHIVKKKKWIYRE